MYLLLLNAVLIFASLAGTYAQGFTTPDNDPFYVPPSGFQSAPLGTVFRSRDTARQGVSGSVFSRQILFRTSGANLEPTVTAATVLQGQNTNKRQLYVLNSAEDSNNSTCQPSYWFNSNTGNTADPTDSSVNTAFGWGATVVIIDHEGVNSSFTAGHLEGRQVLDGIRATLNYAPAGLVRGTAIVSFGYSGGALATGWAAALKSTYAPELNIVGWAFGGTPANLTSTLLTVDGTISAALAFEGFSGQLTAYQSARDLFDRISTADGRAAIASVRQRCNSDNLGKFANEKFVKSTKYQTLGPDLLSDPTFQSFISQSTMALNATETPKVPIYMFHGTVDAVVPYDSARAAATTWCSRGSQIQFSSNQGTGHLGTYAALQGDALNWLFGRLNGFPAAFGCQFQDTFKAGVPF